MANHFTAVGFDAASNEGLVRTVLRAAEEGDELTGPDGATYILWADPSGACLSVVVREARITCSKPLFLPSDVHVLRGVRGSIGASDVCPDCVPLVVELPDGSPLAVELDLTGMARVGVASPGARLDVAVAAVAEGFSSWPDEASYSASQSDDGARLAAQSHIPLGMFGPEPAARSLITGFVRAVRQLTNEATGLPFMSVEVDTYQFTCHVVAEPSLVDPLPAVGSIVRVEAWMVGRLVGVTSDEASATAPPAASSASRFGWRRRRSAG